MARAELCRKSNTQKYVCVNKANDHLRNDVSNLFNFRSLMGYMMGAVPTVA
jgi:hypothetical protein